MNIKWCYSPPKKDYYISHCHHFVIKETAATGAHHKRAYSVTAVSMTVLLRCSRTQATLTGREPPLNTTPRISAMLKLKPPAHHVVIVRVSVVSGLARGIRLCCVTDVLQPQAGSGCRFSLLCWTQHCCSRKGKYLSTTCIVQQNTNQLP